MTKARVVVGVGLLVATAVLVAVAASQVRDKHALAVMTADDIEAQLRALDPATRAAVLARLAADAGRVVHEKRASKG